MLDPLLQKQLTRFRKNRRGFYSFLVISILFFLSLFSELICNNRPVVMKFEGNIYFPIIKFYSGSRFGEHVQTEVNYKEFRKTDRFTSGSNWMVFPPIPYSTNEALTDLGSPPPTAPSSRNWLGTDDRGRDLATRLIYGFRNSMFFALVSWFFIIGLAYTLGAVQGYLGGRVDLYGQRMVEIWSSLPVLYIIIFLVSLLPPSLVLLTVIWVAFSWVGLASYVRTEVLRVRKMDFVVAAKALGIGVPRILFRHILPNTLTPIITFSPFIFSASISLLF
ncbi:MAG: ABC transporter permease subunit [Deltaproteobacteria bacterium]|nr:ABC transporter permease subunit [Deltaproteobacteria bacterium]